MTPVRRVVHVLTFASPNPLLEDIVRRLPAHGWEPVVCTLAPPGPLHLSLNAANIAARSLGWRRRPDHVAASIRLARILRGAAIVHAHVFEAVFAATIAAALARVPLVITRHEGPDLVRRAPGGGIRRGLFHALDRALVCRADAVVAPSEAVRGELARMGAPRGRTELIPMGIDLARASGADLSAARSLRAELAPNSGFVGIVAGRLSWEKKFDVVIRAWSRFMSARPDARLLVAGDGPERGRLERLATEHGIGHAVTFLGWRTDVRELIVASDVVVHVSAIESTGLIAVEALVLGRPLIATATGLVAEQLEDGVHCTVIPHDDPVSLASALSAISASPDRFAAQAERGRGRIFQVAGVDRMVASYARLYDVLAAGPAVRGAHRAAGRAGTGSQP